MNHILQGVAGTIEETPKAGDQIFERAANIIIGGNFDALLKAKEKADLLGYNTVLLSSLIEGETRDVAQTHAAIAKEVAAHGYPVRRLPASCPVARLRSPLRGREKAVAARNLPLRLRFMLREWMTS